MFLVAGATLMVGGIAHGSAVPVQKKTPTFKYADPFGAFRESKQGKKTTQDLDKQRLDLTKKIQEMEQQFTAAVKEFQAKASTLSESALEKEKAKMVKMERDYKAKLQESDDEMKIAMQSAQERLLREYNEAVSQYAKANNIDLVFGPGGVVYSSEKANCTKDIVANMDKSYLAKTKGQTQTT